MHYFALFVLVSAVSCSVIRYGVQTEDRVERMKRELNPAAESVSILVDTDEKISSDSLVQLSGQTVVLGLPSDAEIQRAAEQIGRQTQTFVNKFNKELQKAYLQPNSAHTSSVSMQVMLGTVIMMTLVKMMI